MHTTQFSICTKNKTVSDSESVSETAVTRAKHVAPVRILLRDGIGFPSPNPTRTPASKTLERGSFRRHIRLDQMELDPKKFLNPLLWPGCCFRPTDAQMVELFLVDKLLDRRRFSYSQIKDGIDVYLHDPDDLPIDIRGSSQIWAYFLVKGAHFNRKTPGGYWELADREVEEEEIIGDGERILGYMKEFVFYRGISPDGVKTDWMMKEYRLNLDEVKHPIDPEMENYVVCMIYKEIPDPFPCKECEEENYEE